MKLLKFICLALVLSSPVGATEIGDKVAVKIICQSKESITSLAVSDAQSLDIVQANGERLLREGKCKLLSQPLPAIVTEVIMDYNDWNGEHALAVQVRLIHPRTGQPHPTLFYTVTLNVAGNPT